MSNPHAEHTQNIRNWKIAQLEGGGRGVRLACVSEQKQRLRKRDGQIEEEKGTGYFSTSFRGPSSRSIDVRLCAKYEKKAACPLIFPSIRYRRSGFPGGLLPGGLTPLAAGGATSGFVEMPGSRLGGFTAARGSPCFSGTCWIPGSIWEGGTDGVPDSKSF